MLEQLRRNSRSLIVWVLFGIIIFIFVVSFGPQADEIRCGGSASYAVRVDGSEVQPSSWRFGMNGLGEGGDAQQRRQRVIDLLVGREILALAAEDAGLRVSDDIVNHAIADGEFYFLGSRLEGQRRYFEDDIFNYDSFRRFAQGLGQSSAASLIEEQRREHLANKMRSLVTDSVTVSRAELRDRFVRQNTTVTAEHVTFDVSDYEAALALTDEDLDAYLEHFGDDVRQRFEDDRHRYQGVSEQVEVRYIQIRGDDDEAARAAAEARDRIVSGESFADVAREMSDDPRTARRGGYMGWRPAGSLGLGRAVSDATEHLDVGEISEVLEGDDGYYVVTFEEKREGDLEFDDVKYEIARDLAGPFFARAAAQRDAQAALARIEQGDSFEDVFPEGQGGGGDPEHSMAPAPQLPDVPAQAGGTGDTAGEQDDGEAQAAEGTEAGDGDEPDDSGEQAEPPADEGAEFPAELIPQPVDLAPPARQTLGPTPRSGDELEGIGDAPELSRALFDELGEGEFAEQVFEVGDGFVLARLESRSQADMDEFEDQIDQLRMWTELEKGTELLFDWVQGRCRELAAEGRIEANPEYFLAETGEGAQDVRYAPCQTLTFEDTFRQLQSRMMPQ